MQGLVFGGQGKRIVGSWVDVLSGFYQRGSVGAYLNDILLQDTMILKVKDDIL